MASILKLCFSVLTRKLRKIAALWVKSALGQAAASVCLKSYRCTSLLSCPTNDPPHRMMWLVVFRTDMTSHFTDSNLWRRIALNIREAGRGPSEPGRLQAVQAIGWWLEEANIAQVSTNLNDHDVTPIHVAYEEVCKDAAALNLPVVGSEIVGLVPLATLLQVCTTHHFCTSHQFYLTSLLYLTSFLPHITSIHHITPTSLHFYTSQHF